MGFFGTSAPIREVVQGTFGGLYTESPPENLPKGASPRCNDVDFELSQVTIRPGLLQALASGGALLFQWVKTARLLAGLQLTICQDSSGSLWSENLTSQGTITKFYSGIINNARAMTETVNQREYICLSNLIAGSDQPRQYDGVNLDRISQVGPGSGPSVPVVPVPTYSIISIVQPYAAQSIDSMCWGSQINLYNAPPASTNLYVLGAVSSGAAWFGDLEIGDLVYISGAGNLEGDNPNGTYGVAAMGYYTDINGTRPYFMVVADQSNSDFARGTAGGTYQKTEAVIQLSTPIPTQDAQVGYPIVVSGASPQQWNASWEIKATPTVGQLLINSTTLTSNVATYGYSLASGTAPGWMASTIYLMFSTIVDTYGHVWQVTSPGTSGGATPFPPTPSPGATQADGSGTLVWTYKATAQVLVTVFNTANGNGVFNIAQQPITYADSTTFKVAIVSQNFSAASEVGQAVSGQGNVLIIDPGAITLNSGHPGNDPIYGTDTTGTVTPTSGDVAAGQRYCIVMFQTRNGYITPASPPVSFYTTGETTQVVFNNLPLGPPNVVARIIAITAANSGIGGPYFYIPNPITIQGSTATLGQTKTVSSTVVGDNVSTSSGTLTMNDTVLLNGINVTESGNNLIQQRELGECVKSIQYYGRVFYLGERVKNDEFINLTFDGGVVNSSPAGWTVSPSLNSIATVAASPIVNTSLLLNNLAAPQIVQSATASGSGISSITAAFSVAPTVGNTILFILVGHNGGHTYPSQSGLTTGTVETGTFWNTAVYSRAVSGGDPASWTLGLGGTQSGLTTLTMYEIPGTPALTIASGQVASGPITTGVVTPSGTSLVFSSFIFDNSGYAESIALSPAPYAVDKSYISYAFDANVYTVTARGATLPTSAITITPTPYTPILSPVWSTILCSYGAAGSTINPPGTLLANMATLYQVAFQNVFGEPIIEPNTVYSLRVTAEIPTGNTNGSLVIELYSPSLAQNWAFTVPFSSMTTSIREFIGAFNNPLWQAVPSDLVLRVYPLNFPPTSEVLVDRIEIFPTNQPIYNNQLAASYGINPEAIDGITGAVSTQIFTSETQTNVYKLLNSLYITTWTKTFGVRQQSSEPSGWEPLETTNTIGCVGPMAIDQGEEYVLHAAQSGLYIFDGGNHNKISQEIQSIWNYIYQPSLSTIWVRRDLFNKRILVGVPLPTPNKWLPNAPSNPDPAYPNVILMCSYLGLESGQAIAVGDAVVTSMFAGRLLFKEGHRKWTIWQIASPYSNWIYRNDGSQQLWTTGTGKINQLSPNSKTDNGAVIPENYVTFGFNDKETEQTLQLGAVRKLLSYGVVKINGAGNWTLTTLPENIETPNANTQPPFPLSNPELDDTNMPINESGNAIFLQFSTDGVAGSWFTLKQFVGGFSKDPWLPISGR